MRVLIVDDSLTVRMDLSDAFEEAGFSVKPCANAADARTALQEEGWEVVVLDVVLPDGDGVEILKEIRASAVTSVVLMLSSETDVKDRIRGLCSGADEYVGKPYDRDYVVDRARQLLEKDAPAETEHRSPLILLVDDSATVREMLSKVLQKDGYRVITAGSGEEGLRMAATHRPSAMVVDGILPGIDGATVIRRVRLDSALRGIPCVLLTGSEDIETELSFLEMGADAYLRKEEPTEIILARLSAVLRGAQQPAGERTASLLGPKKVLAVDDSPTYLNELSQALAGEGYDLVCAHCGEDALELLAVFPVDCILLDLMMPGLGGAETCRQIKASPGLREIPLMMVTGREDKDATVEALGAGADDAIAKSADFAVLRARLRAQLRRRQIDAERRRWHADLLQKEFEAAEARSARELAETRAGLIAELEIKNKELEAFSYSVSHDLRAPLRAIDGFSAALLRDNGAQLDERGQMYLSRVRTATERMGLLIDDLLMLSRITSCRLERTRCDVTATARQIASELTGRNGGRSVEFCVQEGLTVQADLRMLTVLLENLLGNAWKFTSQQAAAQVSLEEPSPGEFCVRDNGAGFDMTYADKLFTPFQRYHSDSEFEGTGIGLATVFRVVTRHRGRVWAESAVGQGTSIHFSLVPQE